MEISGLDLTLRRMNQIETGLQQLFNTQNEASPNGFENVLNEKLNETTQKIDGKLPNMPLQINVNPFINQGINTETGYDNIISRCAKENNMDESLIKAVIKAESGFNPNAVSPVGAQGMMQLMPATARNLGVNNPYDPEQNISGGTKYLKGLIDRFNGKLDLAVAAYNAGPNAVNKYGGIPPYNETQNYVKKVFEYQKQFAGIQ